MSDAMNEVLRYQRERAKLEAAHAYDRRDEHDACGVGLVVAIDGKPRREVVTMAIGALKSLWHRGAVDADGKTGDGAGILLDAPQDFFREVVERTGHTVRSGPIIVGQIFLPRNDFAAQEHARTIVESEIIRAGFELYGWRQVPVDIAMIGEKAHATRPEIEQVLFHDPQARDERACDKALFVVRRRIEKKALATNITELYVCSLSAQTLIYKGMFLAEQIDSFYPDLKDERFVSSVAIYHQRYSTNTFPQWRLAQPFRMLAHNGEINTLKGNINWMKSHEIRMTSDAFGAADSDVKPIIQPGASDSAALDNVFEVLVRAGRPAPMAKALLVPEAWAKSTTMPPAHRALYAYCNSVMEPWDGPAALAMFDGKWAVAGMDRNGLRPMRYALTTDGLLVTGSEAGMCALPDARVARRGRVGAGKMIAVDTEGGRFYDETEIVDKLAAKHPYEKWLENIIELESRIMGDEPRLFGARAELLRRQTAAGLTLEDLELILQPMIEEGKEAIGSMGDDAPLAVLSDRYRPLSHYFRQNFSQVTNPPIDPLREDRVMSLATRFKNLGNILAQDETQTEVFVLSSPVLTNGMYARMTAELGDAVAVIDCTFDATARPEEAGPALRAALDGIRAEAEEAVLSGRSHVVLTDEFQSATRVAMPMILATGAVQTHLVSKGLRSFCSISVRSAECLDTHYFAVLIGCGATTVNAYLTLDSIADRVQRGLGGGLTVEQAAANYKRAIDAGLLKILSKMGIAVISSYRGGMNFEAIGLSRALAAEYFPGLTSRISGIGLGGLAQEAAELNARAFDEDVIALPVGGLYRWRASGERHALEAKHIHQLQHAVTTGSFDAYMAYSNAVRERRLIEPIQLRDLLEIRDDARPSISLEQVESVNEIRKRFVTPGMSLGALSPEAHGTLNVAMNRIGAKSVSGEGGEDRARYTTLPNGDNMNSAVKQIASGRFGVTAEYLNQCKEIEIKVAQGAKPGEGGQLPGFKVTELIARLRHATPGVMLISPPPHHDIYSIEDLAQLIYDLKNANPAARIHVKLVSENGVGTVAAGVSKAHADVVLISGHDGGTGATPLTSMKHAGAPWELGLAETQQTLLLNGLRDRIVVQVDGQLKTGRDVVIAALLGAEEFGFATAPLVVSGCIMMRVCHLDTCPVGVATQNPVLRKRFNGQPEFVENFFMFIAEEVRELMAELGFRTVNEMVGQVNALDTTKAVSHWKAHKLDLTPVLHEADSAFMNQDLYCSSRQDHGLDKALDQQLIVRCREALDSGTPVRFAMKITNTNRAVGTMLGHEVTKAYGAHGLPDGTIDITFDGSAGNSFGAFVPKGITLRVHGDANDYVGKGLSGGRIVLRPSDRGPQDYVAEDNIIGGNVILFGATSGEAFIRGTVGERFAVRNSGAHAVVEGVGDHGCEYMTGGKVVILGPTGRNFAAGMSGGVAFVYDPDGLLPGNLNAEMVDIDEFADADLDWLHDILVAHHDATDSAVAQRILADWPRQAGDFVKVMPRDYKRVLGAIAEAERIGADVDEMIMAASRG